MRSHRRRNTDQREAIAALQVLERHVFQERRFARAGLADDVDVRKAIFVLDAKHAIVAAKIDAGKAREASASIQARIFLPTVNLDESGNFAARTSLANRHILLRDRSGGESHDPDSRNPRVVRSDRKPCRAPCASFARA